MQDTFILTDYKGKYDIIQDELIDDGWTYQVGTISREEAIRQAPQRVADCIYYGIPPYIGDDKELNKVYDKEMEKHKVYGIFKEGKYVKEFKNKGEAERYIQQHKGLTIEEMYE